MDYVRSLSRQNFADCRLPFRLAIRLRSEDVLIGFTGLKNGTLETNGSAEVFYSIYRDFWNNGYGTEALRAVINFGIKQIGLHRIFAGCDIDNLASKRTMEKAGMHFESMWRQDRMRNGRWTDGLGYSIISDDV